jgi:drug/metabolite transporter (DMT)-like permease
MIGRSLRRSPALLLTLACALWSVATILTKVLLTSVSPVALLVVQLASSAAALWITVSIGGVRFPKTLPVVPLLALGLLNPGVAYTLNMMGLARVSASVSLLLWGAEPVMILVLAALVLHERMNLRLLLAVLVGVIGVALVSGVDGAAISGEGIPLLLSAVLCCAFYTVYSRKLSKSGDPLLIIALQQTAGLCWAMGVLFAQTRYGSFGEISAASPRVLAVAALSGVLYYALAYWLYLTALRLAPASVAGVYFNLVPVFGIAFAFTILHETLTLAQWAGAAGIITSALALQPLTRPAQTPRRQSSRSTTPTHPGASRPFS